MEKGQVSRMMACSVVGSLSSVQSGIEKLTERTGADELMVVSDVFDHQARLRSYALIAEAAQVRPEATAAAH
jgi:alkanesulfonate monooxygenase SsuD/methylene tetrahydromethanopterin reductase-like flavin-dependent oxidoreductase (luciferase family)